MDNLFTSLLDTVFTRYIDFLFPFFLLLVSMLFLDRLIYLVMQAIDFKRWR